MFSFFKKKPVINEQAVNEPLNNEIINEQADETQSIDAIVEKVIAHINAHPMTHFRSESEGGPLRVNTNNKGRFVRFSLQTDVSFHLDTIEIYNKDGRNIAPGKNTIISSSYDNDLKYSGEGALVGKKNGGCNFHTQREKNPWLIVDLGTVRNLDEIVVYNRSGQFYTRALSLKIESSWDLVSWQPIFDNWSVLKNYQNEGDISPLENALLYAAVLEGTVAKTLINKYRSDNDNESALKIHNLVNGLVRKHGLALGPHGFTQTFELSSPERKKLVFSELALILKVINEDFGAPAFISSGTLLGIVRDGQFIGHDDDVDICYISQVETEEEVLSERIRLMEFLKTKGFNTAFSGIAHYWCHTPKGINLDIFTGFTEEGFCSMNPIGRREVKAEDVLPLQKIQSNGVELYLPRNPEPLLVLNYGPNWKTPDPLWTFNWGKAKQDFQFLYL
ncbi:putative phosphorylcholine metabolizing protein [Aliivibrio wodanis]|uniref:Putative phosphorylcholine metabolizing protein n=1 Tax=Aliivibrio wodanis TaxID=80852 RepID=A0A090IM46_9GAMM|nr:putative phosphorylcholine metabolizing protein [Aliivibrio wodanis]